MDGAGVIFLALFAVTLFVLYIAIRRAWGPTLTVGSVGAILSMLFVILYALTSQNNSAGQAIFAGLVVGLGFSIGVVIIAAFFRTNQPSAEIQLITQSQQEESTSGRHDHDQTPE
jgi:ABC-type Fe3+-siderophore transport system permease subunit